MDGILSVIQSIGGPVVLVLLILSIAATTLVLFKLYQWLTLGKNVNGTLAQAYQHLEQGEFKKALLLTRNNRHPRLKTFAALLELSRTSQGLGQEAQQEVRRIARLGLLPLFQGLRPLEVIATIAPLLGLFGTVLGMIEAFKAMESAGAQVDPSVLSGGIWQALLTTAYGLAVAIPVSLLHSLFERKTETEVVATQDLLEAALFRFNTDTNWQAGQLAS